MNTAALPWRFWAKVRQAPNGCWEWTASRVNGYGQFVLDETHPRRAHRVAYEALVGPIPTGYHLHHDCLTPACVNPEHLRPVAPGEHARLNENKRGRFSYTETCKNGHPLESSPTGQRRCPACNREYQRRYKQRKSREQGIVAQRDRTHCPQGHPYDEANTYVDRLGRRHCRICRKKHWQAWYDRHHRRKP